VTFSVMSEKGDDKRMAPFGSPASRVVNPTALTGKASKLRRTAKECVSGLAAGG